MHGAPAHTLSEGYAITCVALRDSGVRSKLGTVRRSTSAVVGHHDTGTPPAITQAIADAIEGAQFDMFKAACSRPA